MTVIDGSGLSLGRLASVVAKRLLNGEQIDIVNAESIVISGNPYAIERLYKERAERGSKYKGPFQSKRPDRFVKRAIRGMLPYKKTRGALALKRLRVWLGVPEKFEKQEREVLKNLKSKAPHKVTVGQICKKLGWVE